MSLRSALGLLAALAMVLSFSPDTARAYDREEILSGGAPQGRPTWRLFQGFGGGGEGPVMRQTVMYQTSQPPGAIVVNTRERRLYYVLGNGMAVRYGIGVGRDGFTWGGAHRITAKREWPSWTPPAAMLRRQPYLPRFMKGGPDNPLGARALYIGSTIYRIHGSNEPETIGTAVSSGCFRMTNADVIDLYSRVQVEAPVVVQR